MVTGISNDALYRRLSSNLNKVNKKLTNNLKKLSTGLRINKASDDPAGLAVAVQLQSDITSFRQSLGNIYDATSMMSTAEGGLGQISNMLSKAHNLAIQASTGTFDNSSREVMNAEFNSIKAEITRVAKVTAFGDQKLINGDLSASSSNQVDVQVGSANDPSNRVSLNVIEGSTSSQLGIQDIDISTKENARNAIGIIENAINQSVANRAGIGALTNRLSEASSHLGISIENLSSAVSGIQDLDFATETADFAKNQILQSAALASIGQANAAMIGRLVNLRV